MAAPPPYYPPELESWPELVNTDLATAVDTILTERPDITQVTQVQKGVDGEAPSPRQQGAVRVIIYYDIDPSGNEFVSVPVPAISD